MKEQRYLLTGGRELVLCSASPRREELLNRLGLPFPVFRPKVEERVRSWHYRSDLRATVRRKIDAFDSEPRHLLIGCDTVVLCHGRILGKPGSHSEALEFLKMLRAHRHQVISCFGIKYCMKTRDGYFDPRPRYLFRKKRTVIRFRSISDREISDYVESGSPFDKAGGYGLQEANFVKEIRGDRDNAVGLPISAVIKILLKQKLLKEIRFTP